MSSNVIAINGFKSCSNILGNIDPAIEPGVKVERFCYNSLLFNKVTIRYKIIFSKMQ